MWNIRYDCLRCRFLLPRVEEVTGWGQIGQVIEVAVSKGTVGASKC